MFFSLGVVRYAKRKQPRRCRQTNESSMETAFSAMNVTRVV
ncbi:MAG: hypothetical protein SPI30_00845 [Prevotella sp.]|nr:hypothetical protein [Prevotella sp.]